VLGSPFLNDYYQVYDIQRNQIGLVPSIYANPSPQNMTVPQADNVDEKFTNVFCLCLYASFLFLTVIVRIIVPKCCINKERIPG
jgi:hypothetical protein